MRESQVITALGALAHQSRLRIVRKLIVAGDAGLSAGAIARAISAAPSKVSFHLAALEQAKLVTSERVSRNIVYRVDYLRIGKLMNFMLADCCGGNQRILSCCDTSSRKCCD